MENLTLSEQATTNFCYAENFKYTHDNPYHDRLGVFTSFVLRDEEAENFKNKWKQEIFQKSDSPLCVEIGTGYGDFMLDYCQQNPSKSFVGLDHRFKRSFSLAKKLEKIPHKNFRYLRARGERLGFMFGENEIDELFYFFPDPWPKTRHHKKRLFNQAFLNACLKVIKKDGYFFIKTDHDDYFEWMLKELQLCKDFKIILQSKDLRSEFPEHFLSQFATKFEKIFLSQGKKIKALVLQNSKEEN
jgi:tRNA (guanine-N7-)-methyltransferase